MSQTVSAPYNRSLIETGKSIVLQINCPPLFHTLSIGIRGPFLLGSGPPKHPGKWNCWSIGKTLHCQTITQMCSLQTGKYPIEFYWYAAISVSALFPRVGNSIPDRYKRKCIKSYLSCPAAVLSVDPLPLCYNPSFVHRSLSPKSSYVMYWSSSWRALRPVWGIRNCRIRYWSLYQILRAATLSEIRSRKSWYKFFHPRNPSQHSSCEACRSFCARVRNT